MLKITQCIKGCAVGASGSLTIMAKVCVPLGASLHCNEGEMFFPSAVNWVGIKAPLPKSELCSVKTFGVSEAPESPRAGNCRQAITKLIVSTQVSKRFGVRNSNLRNLAANM